MTVFEAIAYHNEGYPTSYEIRERGYKDEDHRLIGYKVFWTKAEAEKAVEVCEKFTES